MTYRSARTPDPEWAGLVGDYQRNRQAQLAMYQKWADAEQEKSTGGMVALYPRADFAEAMAVQDGEPVEDLHLTLAYLGEDVTDLPKDYLVAAIAQLADSYTTAITARVFAHAIFNPDGGSGGDKDPCVVYLIGDCPELTPLRDQVIDTCQTHLPNMHDQHEPFTAHVTAAYAVQSLGFTGPIVFDRLCVEWAGEQIEFPLLEP